jgi:hypothetical protein
MSIDLNDKKLMGHGVTDTGSFHRTPLSIARGADLITQTAREPFPTSCICKVIRVGNLLVRESVCPKMN